MDVAAAVLRAPGAPISIETVTLDPPGVGEVLVRIEAAGVCHTDLEVQQGTVAYPLPIVPGHEGAGEVVEVGAGVTALRPGDRVIASWNPACGSCFYCVRDQPILCERCANANATASLLDGSSRLRSGGDGSRIGHFGFVSSFTEYAVWPESGAIPVANEMPADRACLIGCAVMTGVGAVTNVARVRPGSSVAVIGCGVVGLSVVLGAGLAGAGHILAVDRNPARLALAKRLGAGDALMLGTEDAVAWVRERTANRGADYVFEAAGAAEAFDTALAATRSGGSTVLLGKVDPAREVSIKFGSLSGERKIVRSSYGGARPARDFPALARLYLDGRLDVDPLVTGRVPLSAVNDALAQIGAQETIRTVIQPART